MASSVVLRDKERASCTVTPTLNRGYSVLHCDLFITGPGARTSVYIFHCVVRADFLVTGSSNRLAIGCYSVLQVPFFRLGGLFATGGPGQWVRSLLSLLGLGGEGRDPIGT